MIGTVQPPVIDQQVEVRQGFDMVPPHARYKDRIAGLEHRGLGML